MRRSACYGRSVTSNKQRKAATHIKARFPKDPQLREKWIKAISSESFEPSAHSRVCSKHFGGDCFSGNSWSSKHNLKYDTIPCVSEVPGVSRIQPIEVVNVPCLKIENKSASLNNEIAEEDDSLESAACTDEDNLSFQQIPLKRKRAYIGDFLNSDTITDHEKHVHIIAITLAKKNKQIKTLQQTNRRLL
ncbi:THAP domain-containing protein 2-like isoform X2 [Lasioglossum baleicum]|uniref:THAP domain-containing protein 2-like isoform X2 n=1 Tax=Lasioglossum baleicum TaxID=434251 RepID=UPI003FCECEA7